jgi:NAD+ kinase
LNRSKTTIAIVASQTAESQQALAHMHTLYESVDPKEATVIVVIGGDGFMLQTLHQYRHTGLPVFGMKTGTIGFLMNLYRAEDVLERIKLAQASALRPLKMIAVDVHGKQTQLLAFNEVSLLRQASQAAKIKVTLNEQQRMTELVCDGVMVATPAGSTAYNLSAHGPILPLGCDVLALTPIAPFRPRRWRGAIIRSDTVVKLEVLEHDKRPVSATADSSEVRHIVQVTIAESPADTVTLLFDPEHNLEERILSEQFAI